MKSTTIVVVLVAIIAVVAVALLQQQRLNRATSELDGLREQIETNLPALEAENQSLKEQLEDVTQRMESNLDELLKLRGQYSKLRQLEQESASLRAERDRLVQNQRDLAQQAVAVESAEPEVSPLDQTYGAGVANRALRARDWGLAQILYANRHDGQYPAQLADAAPFLSTDLTQEERAQAMVELNRFEVVYRGRRDALSNLPAESTIVIREKQPWRAQNGEWAKIYVYANGTSIIQSLPDGRFEAWEALRIPR